MKMERILYYIRYAYRDENSLDEGPESPGARNSAFLFLGRHSKFQCSIPTSP